MSSGRICTIEKCTDPYKARGFCNRHYLRWKHHGDPHHVEPRNIPPVLRGADNFKWKGDDIKYAALHHRLRRTRGQARDRQCARCERPGANWAYDRLDENEVIDKATGFPFSLDFDHYIPLCLPCHWRQDRPGVAKVAA